MARMITSVIMERGAITNVVTSMIMSVVTMVIALVGSTRLPQTRQARLDRDRGAIEEIRPDMYYG